jgi:hypothetical protein
MPEIQYWVPSWQTLEYDGTNIDQIVEYIGSATDDGNTYTPSLIDNGDGTFTFSYMGVWTQSPYSDVTFGVGDLLNGYQNGALYAIGTEYVRQNMVGITPTINPNPIVLS